MGKWSAFRAFSCSLKISGLTYTSNENIGFLNGTINYLGKLSYQAKNSNSVLLNTHFSSDARLLKGNLKGKLSLKKIDFTGDYEFVDQNVDNRLSEDLEAIDVSSAYNFFDKFNIVLVGIRYYYSTDGENIFWIWWFF